MATDTSSSGRPQPDAHWDAHYSDERDAAFLYRSMAETEANGERRQLFERLARVEDRHVQRWTQLFEEAARPLPPYTTALRTRALAWAARRFGSRPTG